MFVVEKIEDSVYRVELDEPERSEIKACSEILHIPVETILAFWIGSGRIEYLKSFPS